MEQAKSISMEQMQQKKDRVKFSSRIGFVLAAASSAVGLGNLWRFPYLAAKYGGGIFLLTYIVLALTFGFSLLVAEIAIGRKTGLSSVAAFKKLGQKSNICGILGMIIPMIITPYYCTIGGWVTKYFATFVTGQYKSAATDDYFTGFITSDLAPVVYLAVFLVLATVIVLLGVQKGIEKASVILMPILLGLIVIISIYVVTRPGATAGLSYYFKPDFSKISGKLILGALGQLFYSNSIAMGIMITYGSYMEKKENLVNSVHQIEFFDSVVAILAGLIIVPSVYIFSGGDASAMGAGPGLMFVTLPKVFDSFPGGGLAGIAFFALVLFAALTSAISLLEAVVSNIMDLTHMSRFKATILSAVYCVVVGSLCSLGFGPLSNITILNFDILDFLDFISNSVMMPILAFFTAVFIGFKLKPEFLIAEAEEGGASFRLKKFWAFMIKWICPIGIVAILVSSILSGFGLLSL
uniref:sodium-dependent transporter n=1 Tax=Eubacterium cellulosolvens TaxID=29322 RepID=UPI000AE4032C|nr:sodium-dependent transporter [[Eubacterium] cellulosolvens]